MKMELIVEPINSPIYFMYISNVISCFIHEKFAFISFFRKIIRIIATEKTQNICQK